MHVCADAAAATKQTLNAQYRDNLERVKLRITASLEVLECDNLWSGGLHEPTGYTDKLIQIATAAILRGVWDRRLLLRKRLEHREEHQVYQTTTNSFHYGDYYQLWCHYRCHYYQNTNLLEL